MERSRRDGYDPGVSCRMPWWFGYSTGRWFLNSLVVETTGFRDDGWLDVNGSPLTDAAKVTERFTPLDHGHLDIEITVDDAKAYTKPWTVTVKHELSSTPN